MCSLGYLNCWLTRTDVENNGILRNSKFKMRLHLRHWKMGIIEIAYVRCTLHCKSTSSLVVTAVRSVCQWLTLTIAENSKNTIQSAKCVTLDVHWNVFVRDRNSKGEIYWKLYILFCPVCVCACEFSRVALQYKIKNCQRTFQNGRQNSQKTDFDLKIFIGHNA